MSNNRKVYSFKSVGLTQDEFTAQRENVAVRAPIGILTPVSFAESGGTLFSMSFDIKDQIRDNLKNLLLTNKGERLMLGDFGADLRLLTLDVADENIINSAISRISRTVNKYMPFVDLQDFETRTEPSLNGNTVGTVVRVTYSVPSIGLTNQAVEVVIYAAG